MEEEKNCKNCQYFLNCATENTINNQECLQFPSVPGFCQLWNGPLVNYEICTGFTAKI